MRSAGPGRARDPGRVVTVVVVAAAEVGVGAGWLRGRLPRTRCSGPRGGRVAQTPIPERSSCGWSIAHCSTCMPPSEPPIAASGRWTPRWASSAPVDAHEVGDGEEREAQPVRPARRRIRRRRARRAAGSRRAGWRRPRRSGRCRRGLPGPISVVPPARPGRVSVVAGGMRVAGQGVADEHALAPSASSSP